MIIDGEKYLTEKEISRQYGISLSWIRQKRHKEMPYYKVGGMVLFKTQEIDQWLKKNMRHINENLGLTKFAKPRVEL